MQVLYCRAKKLGSRIIQAATWSEWSHVALINQDRIIEAVYPQVQYASLDARIAHSSSYVIVEYPGDTALTIAAAESQIGKPYDWTALVGIYFRRDWQEMDSWFCSELVAWAACQGGFRPFRHQFMSRITPQHLWMLDAKIIAGG